MIYSMAGCHLLGHLSVSVSLFHLCWLTSLSRNSPAPVASLNQSVLEAEGGGSVPRFLYRFLRQRRWEMRQVGRGRCGQAPLQHPSLPLPEAGGKTALGAEQAQTQPHQELTQEQEEWACTC